MVSRTTQSLVAVVAVVAVLALSACVKEKGGDMGEASATPAGNVAMDAAEYTLVFKSNWTTVNHPFEYPANAHFSGIIGAAHSGSFALFKQGSMPTPGLEKLSEQGMHMPLDEEIKAAVTAGTAMSLFTTGPLRDMKDSIVTTVRVDATHPMVSFAAMVAPSPDWFTGASDVTLLENGAWAASRTIQLYAWDSGGDDGVTYKAADKDNMPKKPTMQAMTRHFVSNGAPVPVAIVTLTRR